MPRDMRPKRLTIIVWLTCVGLIPLSGMTCASPEEIAIINSPQPGETIPASGLFTVSMNFVTPLTPDSTLQIELSSDNGAVVVDVTSAFGTNFVGATSASADLDAVALGLVPGAQRLIVRLDLEGDGVVGTRVQVFKWIIEVAVETLNVALAGAFIPFEAERRVPIINAIPTTDADIICLQEVWEQADKDAIVAAAAGQFPYSVSFTHDLDTPVDDPTDQNGQIPSMPSGVPCPDANTGDQGANIADQVDQAAQCLADFCSTTGDATGQTTSAACAASACLLPVAPLLLGNELQQRCYACAITQLPTEVIGTLADRCKTIENQDLAFRGQNGVMILSKFPLSNEEVFVVPGTWNRRVIINATATLPNDAELDVYCNHLTPIFTVSGVNTFPYTGQYGGGAATEPEQWAAEQQLQAEKLIQYVQQTSGTRRAVVLGDINAGREVTDVNGDIVLYAEGEPTLDVLESVLTLGAAADYEPLCTFCDTNPLNGVEDTLPAWIDLIYLYQLDASTVVSTERTFDEDVVPVQVDDGMGGTTNLLVPLSDHYGLKSVIHVP